LYNPKRNVSNKQIVETENFEPKIIGFLCNWCSYAAADLAGVSRIQYPPNLRIIRVMCTGRISDTLILSAFSEGVDGVLIAGCHPGECHYQKGNLLARRRVVALKYLLEAMGIGEDRLRLVWAGASEGPKFAETVTSFTEKIKQLGPSPFKKVKVDTR